MTSSSTIVWFRLDLRLRDNPALNAAVRRKLPIVPVFIWSPEEDGAWPPGAASRVWLHGSLQALDASLRERGSRLIIRQGNSLETLERLVDETNADAVVWNRRYEPASIMRDARITSVLKHRGLHCESFNSALLEEPWENVKRDGTPYMVFTPFANASAQRLAICKLAPTPRQLSPLPKGLRTGDVASLNLLPAVRWDAEIRSAWGMGECAAQKQLKRFLTSAAESYEQGRNLPAVDGVSRLSPYLHFGEISPRQVWSEVQMLRSCAPPTAQASLAAYQKELLWREFSHHLLFHFPHMPERPLRREFERFPWRKSSARLRAWQQGRTGYPIVDAGMRQLWRTGWMHNRVRMIVGSFLVKDLLVSWEDGQRWFWDTLVDADLAQNSMNWQWIAGCGADAAPFFRIFNPITQGERFDPQGSYIAQFVPELAALPPRWLHCLGSARMDSAASDRLQRPARYPVPIIDHAEARSVALLGYAKTRAKAE